MRLLKLPAKSTSRHEPKLSSILVLSSISCLLACCVLAQISHAQGGTDGESGTKPLDDSTKTISSLTPNQRGASAMSKPYGYYLKPILERIQANPDQSAKITAILQSYRSRIEPLKSEYVHKNQEFLNNLSRGEDSARIMNEQIQLGHIYSDITLYYCQMSLEVRKVLSPEQIVRYEEFKRQQGWASTPTAPSTKNP